MNSALFTFFFAFTIFRDYATAHPVKYDQRQEGDLNVRTDVEDVVFVMVMPQDLIAGMGLVAANAVDLLRNYGGIGPERWPMRTPGKVGFVPLEKSPYKIDLEKSGVKVKKISPAGDPNRYNFNDVKNPTKAAAPEVKVTTSTEVPEKSTMEISTEIIQEMQSTTESKTVKKVLKPEEIKKAATNEEKKPVEKKKEEKPESELVKKSEEVKPKFEENISEEQPRVIGDSMDPTSILRIEGCGPDAKRDSTGRCVYMKLENSSKGE